MKIFFDTEFINLKDSIHLLSIGMIRDDGEVYYAELESTDRKLADKWVKKHVIPYLNGPLKSRDQIAFDIKQFCGNDPDFWAFFGSFDMLLLKRIFGGMIDWPANWPEYVNDICKLSPDKKIPVQKSVQHHALNDAIWVKDSYEFLIK